MVRLSRLRPVNRFGIYLTFPECLNAEAEIINRIIIAAKKIDIICLPIDDELWVYSFDPELGFIKTNEKISAKMLDFIISTHFKSPKSTECFTYGT